MGEVTPEPAATAQGPEVRYALGGGAMLLAGVCAALLMAFVMSRTLGGLYVTFLMPALAGWLLGGAVGWVGARFLAGGDRLPMVLTVALTGALAYGGYHLLAYAQVVDLLVENLTSAIERAAANPSELVMRYLEQETGEEGVAAYLAFVSTMPGSELSPIGLIGRGGLGVGVTVVVCVVELAALIGAALVSAARRLGGSTAVAAPTRASTRVTVIARVDDDGVVALMKRVEAGEFDEAGRALAAPTEAPTHAVVIEHVPGTSDPWTLSIRALGGDGELGPARAERKVSSFDGESLWDELRMARRARGEDGPR